MILRDAEHQRNAAVPHAWIRRADEVPDRVAHTHRLRRAALPLIAWTFSMVGTARKDLQETCGSVEPNLDLHA
ncbi:hypothetical protein [Streptomyces sp. NPDC058307]|uniref:hypothetical protein n=1 Tax=Streptomyces sp. NPDC058307 TaxID=3346439 RepID=UPI0036ED1422